jgi:hypothetical protein
LFLQLTDKAKEQEAQRRKFIVGAVLLVMNNAAEN